MKKVVTRLDAIRLIRFASFLWIGYLIVLILISQSFPGPQSNFLVLLYYLLLGCVALICLGLSYWSWLQKRLRQAFVPVIVAFITVMPIIIRYSIDSPNPFGQRFDSLESSVLAMFPFLFVALLLVAWQYKWQYILLVILGFVGLNLGVILSSTGPGSPPIMGALILTLIQTVIFLAVGFSVGYLIGRLKEQQESLEEANLQLTRYAVTREQLAVSRERNRIARDLHDTLAHTLSGLAVQLETVDAYWDVDNGTARSTLKKSLNATHSGLEETRRALQALRASPLDDLGLVLAIRKTAEDISARANLSLDLSITDKLPVLSPDVEQCIYRVVQEAVINAAKHAKAKNLKVKLETMDAKVILTIRDDGIGFEEKAANSNHLGLIGMRERAQMVGGELTVISKPREGTTIKLVM